MLSPMMQQYMQIKEQYPDHILFFRLGDFYEMFFQDAKIASRELDLTLTARDCGEEERAPMCGVPFHSYEGYVARLIDKGFKVAICEQTEDPSKTKTLVRREVVRVITPGTVIEDSMLPGSRNSFLASICEKDGELGLCFADISTGEMYATSLQGEERYTAAANELVTFRPREVVTDLSQFHSLFTVQSVGNAMISCLESEYFDANRIAPRLPEGCSEAPADAAAAICGAVEYIELNQRTRLPLLDRLVFYTPGQFLELDAASRRNLEIVETLHGREKKGTLLWVLDRTCTPMGSRTLTKWIEQPLNNLPRIRRRHCAVGELTENMILRDRLRILLDPIHDMERLLSRVICRTANARDLQALERSLAPLPELREVLEPCQSALLKELREEIDGLEELQDLLLRAIAEKPPVTVREGGLIRKGYHAELDEMRHLVDDSNAILSEMEAREREATGIKNLRVTFNRVFGYFIEVTKSNLDQVPPSYIRRQTLTNCERYITQELKELETKVLDAQDRMQGMEYELFTALCDTVIQHTARLRRTAVAIGALDALLSFASVAEERNYTMPQMDNSRTLRITEGRHPVVEAMQLSSLFVPNDVCLEPKTSQLLLITGPNMAGKSTYMRQVALIVLMAQAGSFVPASSAHIGLCDKIFTRIGASDNLAAGQSTFMVEMTEVANILRHATPQSLLIFDEIGRGTSTFDGMSIACAVAEAVVKLGSKALFATHYHEICSLEDKLEGVLNYNIAVKKRGDDIIFLRRIVRGAASASYGIEVAKLAGVPDKVIRRAKEVLQDLENGRGAYTPASPSPSRELPLQDLQALALQEELAQLQQTDISAMTPIEAMNYLYQLQQKIKSFS